MKLLRKASCFDSRCLVVLGEVESRQHSPCQLSVTRRQGKLLWTRIIWYGSWQWNQRYSRYIKELTGRERRDREGTALELLPQATRWHLPFGAARHPGHPGTAALPWPSPCPKAQLGFASSHLLLHLLAQSKTLLHSRLAELTQSSVSNPGVSTSR